MADPQTSTRPGSFSRILTGTMLVLLAVTAVFVGIDLVSGALHF